MFCGGSSALATRNDGGNGLYLYQPAEERTNRIYRQIFDAKGYHRHLYPARQRPVFASHDRHRGKSTLQLYSQGCRLLDKSIEQYFCRVMRLTEPGRFSPQYRFLWLEV